MFELASWWNMHILLIAKYQILLHTQGSVISFTHIAVGVLKIKSTFFFSKVNNKKESVLKNL